MIGRYVLLLVYFSITAALAAATPVACAWLVEATVPNASSLNSHATAKGFFAGLVLAVGVMIAGLVVTHARERRWLEENYRGKCGNCRFDLRGNLEATVCPECGQPRSE